MCSLLCTCVAAVRGCRARAVQMTATVLWRASRVGDRAQHAQHAQHHMYARQAVVCQLPPVRLRVLQRIPGAE